MASNEHNASIGTAAVNRISFVFMVLPGLRRCLTPPFTGPRRTTLIPEPAQPSAPVEWIVMLPFVGSICLTLSGHQE